MNGCAPLDATLLVFPAIVKTPSESWTLIGSEDKRTYLALWVTHALRRMRLVKRESNQFIDERLRVCVVFWDTYYSSSVFLTITTISE